MTTYNGEKYIEKQLISLLNQTISNFQLMIYDDCSSDSTYSIVEKFIEANDLDNWFLFKNSLNIGWKKNFIDALKATDADIILFCDQDDIWEQDHVSIMVQAFTDNKIKLLCSNYVIIDDIDRIVDKKEQFGNDGKISKIPLLPKNFNVLRPGCSYCLRGDFGRKIALSYWIPSYAHDELMWQAAFLANGLYILDKKTLKYRRHESNASGAMKKRSEILDNLDDKISHLNKMIQYTKENNLDKQNQLSTLDRLKSFYILRKKAFSGHKIVSFFRCVTTYANCYISWKHIVLDIKNFFFAGQKGI